MAYVIMWKFYADAVAIYDDEMSPYLWTTSLVLILICVSFFWGTGLVLLMFSCNRFFAACDAHETIYECWAYATAHDAIYMRCQMFELHMIPNYEFNYVSMLLYLLLSLPPYSTTTTLYLLHGTARLGLVFWWPSLWHLICNDEFINKMWKMCWGSGICNDVKNFMLRQRLWWWNVPIFICEPLN